MNASAKTERIDVRLRPELKERIERAAELAGVSLTEFVVSRAYEAAEQTIRDHMVMSLTERDSLRFAEAVLNPSPPNERLRAAARRYRELFGEQGA